MGVLAYIYLLLEPQSVLLDGDTYWHIGAGRWILEHLAIPTQDMFSHTVRGSAWTAHEWLAEVILAATHQWGGWVAVVSLTALAYAATMALLTRALLKWLEPIYAVLFVALAASMTLSHALARPHMLAMPLLMVWAIGLVRASDERRSPTYWLLPVMVVWANLHGGFTLGIALTAAFAAEAVWMAWQEDRDPVGMAKRWALFFLLALGAGMLTPHGPQGFWFTWEVLTQLSFSLEYIGEWRSPNFHVFQPIELWLLGGLALVLHQGLKLPPFRLIILVGLLHLALKHARYIELLGLLAPLVVAAPFAQQWRERQQAKAQLETLDRFLLKLTQPASHWAILAAFGLVVATSAWIARVRPLELPVSAVPDAAITI